MNSLIKPILAAVVMSVSFGALAQSKLPASASQGEVRKLDKAAGKVTLKHGPLENLKMPGMTMPFTVSDPKLLEGLKEGDKVRFVAEQGKGGELTVTALEPATK